MALLQQVNEARTDYQKQLENWMSEHFTSEQVSEALAPVVELVNTLEVGYDLYLPEELEMCEEHNSKVAQLCDLLLDNIEILDTVVGVEVRTPSRNPRRNRPSYR